MSPVEGLRGENARFGHAVDPRRARQPLRPPLRRSHRRDEKPLSFLLDHYEGRDPSLKATHDQLIKEFGEGKVTRDTEVWMNYDIDMKVVPFEGSK